MTRFNLNFTNTSLFRRFTQSLAVASIIGLIMAALSLQDIYSAIEPNLSMEWNTVRIAVVLSIITLVASIFAINRGK